MTEYIIPKVRFHQGRGVRTTSNGMGDVVAVIGEFPCVSATVVSVTSYLDAVQKLNITPGVNDTYHLSKGSNNSKVIPFLQAHLASDGTTALQAGQLDPNSDYFRGAGALRRIYNDGNGAGEIIVINTSTFAYKNANPICVGSTNILDVTLDYDYHPSTGWVAPTATYTPEGSNTETSYNLNKVDVALERLKEEEFDILFPAFNIAPIKTLKTDTNPSGQLDLENYTPANRDTLQKLIDFTEVEYSRSNPVGIIFGYGDVPLANLGASVAQSGSIVGDLVSSRKIQTFKNYIPGEEGAIEVDDYVDDLKEIGLRLKAVSELNGNPNKHTTYGVVAQSLKAVGETSFMSPMESAAYYAGFIASTRVNKSMTARVIDGISDINEEILLEKGTDGYNLVANGITLFRVHNRADGTVECVNSEQPCGLDLAHLRTTAYIIKKMGYAAYLGQSNSPLNIESITALLSETRVNLENMFDIVDSISYTVERHDKNCVWVYITIYYYGIILDVEVFVDEVVI